MSSLPVLKYDENLKDYVIIKPDEQENSAVTARIVEKNEAETKTVKVLDRVGIEGKRFKPVVQDIYKSKVTQTPTIVKDETLLLTDKDYQDADMTKFSDEEKEKALIVLADAFLSQQQQRQTNSAQSFKQMVNMRTSQPPIVLPASQPQPQQKKRMSLNANNRWVSGWFTAFILACLLLLVWMRWL